MKKLMLFSVLIAFTGKIFAQKQTFDLTTFTPPKGWKKQVGKDAIQLSKEDATKGTYCLITLYKSIPATTNAKENFDMAWASLVKEMVTVSAEPEMQPAETENGWETLSGNTTFESDGNKGIAILVTASGTEKMVNMIILTNTDVYQQELTTFIESISLKKLTITPKVPAENSQPAGNTNNSSIVGTWGVDGSDNTDFAINNGIRGYIRKQYTFNQNGTYLFVIKTFSYVSDKLLLTKESGTYQISGNNITINPQKSVIQGWSKASVIGSDGKKAYTDNWGKLISNQNKQLEKTSYQFTKEYFADTQTATLFMRANKETLRDGPFNSTSSPNTWAYPLIKYEQSIIKLPN